MKGITARQFAESFSHREMEILTLMKEGFSNDAIARKVSLSLGTVKWYNRQIFGKLGVSSRTQAIEKAVAMGLIATWGVSFPSKTFPPADPHPKHNLPAPLTGFIGRRKERTELLALLHSASTRLVTLLGPGGIGKTRLVLRVAEEALSDFKHGVWLVDLSSIFDPVRVPQIVANAMGIQDSGGQSYEDFLVRFLSPRRLLLVFDNCEHLVEACARLASLLLIQCPSLHILTTSREALGIEGEALYTLSSLPYPDKSRLPIFNEIRQYEAVQLFVERAALICPGFTLTPENAQAIALICDRLDGIPLALELAAARANFLSVDQIAARLQDCFHLLAANGRMAVPRHQTMRACLDWSYNLLPPNEQALLRRLAVFSGGWTLEAAEEVCTASLDLLNQLVNKSMVIVGVDLAQSPGQEARYRLLEPVRQYALEKMEQAGEVKLLRDRHLTYFTRWAEKIDPKLCTAEQRDALHRMKAEHENLHTAMHWAFGRDVPVRAEDGLHLACTLGEYWLTISAFQEGVSWLEKALAVVVPDCLPWAIFRAKALYYAGIFRFWIPADRDARLLLEESRAIYQKYGDLAGQSRVLSVLGVAVEAKGDIAGGYRMFDEGIRLGRQSKNRWCLAINQQWKGMKYSQHQSWPEARACLEESLELFRQLGDRWDMLESLTLLCRVVVYQGDLHTGRDYLQECRHLFLSEIEEVSFVSIVYLIEVAFLLEEYTGMDIILEIILEKAKRMGIAKDLGYFLRASAYFARMQGNVQRAETFYHESLQNALTERDMQDVYSTLGGIAGLALALDQPERAVQIMGTVSRLFLTISFPPASTDKHQFELDKNTARQKLGEVAFKVAWAYGYDQSLEWAVHEALSFL